MDINNLVDEYYGKVYKLCLFYLKSKEEAEDLVQEVFFKVLKKKSSFKGESDIYTWIYRIAVNTILNYIKRKKIVRFLSFEDASGKGDFKAIEYADDPAVKLETEEQKRIEISKLEKGIGLLSDREKTAFYLFHYDLLKQKEIAEIMKTSVSAVEALVHKATKKIRENLAAGSASEFE